MSSEENLTSGGKKPSLSVQNTENITEETRPEFGHISSLMEENTDVATYVPGGNSRSIFVSTTGTASLGLLLLIASWG